MSVEGFLLLLAIAVIFGSIGEVLAGYSAGNFFVRTGLGLVGALLGRWIPYQFDIPTLEVVNVDGMLIPLAWCIAGAALFVAVTGALWGERAH